MPFKDLIMTIRVCLLLTFLLNIQITWSQKPHQASGSEIYHGLEKLGVLGKVLYLAAHPDDENTRFISYCANEKKYETAYLSLTRGDGGQNLIGPELREELGIMRTQELLAARRIDGGMQFFSRANDFGYSKTAEETLKIWDKDKILSDVVQVIRKFQPDIIVCRFPDKNYGGHGHHIASTLLGKEAFDLAADPKAYPEQLERLNTWQTKRIVVNTGRWWNDTISADDPGVVSEDLGLYNPVLGTSYNEMAALSRSQHKCQGFGVIGTRGELIEYFEHLKGDEAKSSLFDDIIDDWSRLGDEQEIGRKIEAIKAKFKVNEPSAICSDLLELRKMINKIENEDWKSIKLEAVDRLIQSCLGLYLEATADTKYATAGDSIKCKIELVNRSKQKIEVTKIYSSALSLEMDSSIQLENNHVTLIEQKLEISNDLPISQAFWLVEEGSLGTYSISNMDLIGKTENDPSVIFDIQLEFQGTILNYNIPLVFKYRDPVEGESYAPFYILPAVTMNFKEDIQVFYNEPKTNLIKLAIHREGMKGRLNLKGPKGWSINPSSIEIPMSTAGQEFEYEISIMPNSEAENGVIDAYFKSDLGEIYNKSLVEIVYDHIPDQVYFPNAESKIVNIELEKYGERIGYIDGAGDVIPQVLSNIGYQVDILEEDGLKAHKLNQYDAIVLGIRALNTQNRIDYMMPSLLEYCKNGGTLILQYNTSYRLKTENFAPYPLEISRDRVTEEDAKVSFLKPDHPVLNTPNKISKADFENWVQERGLYFPSEWSQEYEAILSWHDTGEPPRDGSLLVAQYGKGHYIYTGISLFRELPAGVPGAYRLLANLVSLGNGPE